ncbi:MAG: FAD/NAD(P)-binding oxidoreductase [Anaerolineaceae bacterium]|nr:FAD/NAD(P)-binding oxidoreductase [Anaerolineaceae bacterium]
MKTLLVLGAGTAGTMIARKMASRLDLHDWKVVLVDRDENHYYQPGFLFVPFGLYKPEDVVRPKRQFIPSNVEFIISDVELVEPDHNRLTLAKDHQVLNYDYLVIATGSDIHPEQTSGLKDGGWRQNIFDFYTYAGAAALAKFLTTWKGGQLVVNVVENPIKCPVAPLEFLFLADDYFKRRDMRSKVELIYATPLPGAFTKPVASKTLGEMLAGKNIHVEPDYNVGEVDPGKNLIRSYDERELCYDLLVSVPTNMGSEIIARSGMGDELNFVPTDKFTLQSKGWENVWVMGDANNIPASKAGSVIHFQLETVVENLLAHIAGKELPAHFDGHSLCYIETGSGKAVLIDFSYDTEPLAGTYPVPAFGPFSLLRESTFNHWGKLAFRHMYWDLMMRGIEVPLPSKFSMAGKVRPVVV